MMESVWNYPTRPTPEPERRTIRVELGGIVIAESDSTIRLVERGLPPSFYFPPEHTRTDLLVASEDRSLCPVKGTATYWGIRAGERESLHAVWCYPEPIAECEPIRGRFAFYAGRVDRCTVGGESVRSTGHVFYAGWITPDIEGPFVGDADLPEEFQSLLARPVLGRGEAKDFEGIVADSHRVGARYLPK
jgi:uncharacterized protein (DUF427 family)